MRKQLLLLTATVAIGACVHEPCCPSVPEPIHQPPVPTPPYQRVPYEPVVPQVEGICWLPDNALFDMRINAVYRYGANGLPPPSIPGAKACNSDETARGIAHEILVDRETQIYHQQQAKLQAEREERYKRGRYLMFLDHMSGRSPPPYDCSFEEGGMWCDPVP